MRVKRIVMIVLGLAALAALQPPKRNRPLVAIVGINDATETTDYLIVPAMSRDDDPAALEWIRSQAGKGATIIGVCAGAKVVAATGVLDGRRATTHWWYLDGMLDRSPTIRYVPDRRIVASMPCGSF